MAVIRTKPVMELKEYVEEQLLWASSSRRFFYHHCKSVSLLALCGMIGGTCMMIFAPKVVGAFGILLSIASGVILNIGVDSYMLSRVHARRFRYLRADKRIRLEKGAYHIRTDPEVEYQADECAVCLEDMGENSRTVSCGHMFHQKCIDEWMKTLNKTCPLCREKIFS